MKLKIRGSLLAVLTIVGCKDEASNTIASPEAPSRPATAAEVIAEREELDRSVWADEVEAQRYETAFVNLWDRMRAAEDKSSAIKSLLFDQLEIGELQENKKEQLGSGVERLTFSDPSTSLTHQEFSAKVDALSASGYEIVQSEWHHSHFEVVGQKDGQPRSTVNAVLHLENSKMERRLIANLKLKIDWSDNTTKDEVPLATRVSVVEVELLSRSGTPVFQESAKFSPGSFAQGHSFSNPILTYDLDGSGFSEVIMGGRNVLLRRKSDGSYTEEKFISGLPPIFETAVLADFNGDSFVDFVCIGRDGILRIFTGEKGGWFAPAPLLYRGVRFSNAMVITAGDIDRDGDLDIWVGQYKPPYSGGHMPTPYFNANDGLPGYLLKNDGRGGFRDITEGSGLEPKRHRRTYAASFVDLNDDGNLDLLVTSDFAGIDIFLGNGKGGFEDVTDSYVKSGHNFGMSHTFGDFNKDGQLDFYVAGMSSTTARRLDRMGLVREDRPEIHEMRGKMGYGNRMYLAGENKFAEPEFRDSVARTGWSWGSSSLDFENDGDLDLYVANGHQSGKTARDYCSTFWRHDIYTGSSKANLEIGKVFQDTLGLLGRGEVSWNGFEHNALLMNRGQGRGFANVGFLMGVAYEFDARSVVSDDLNGDGRMDILVIGNELSDEGQMAQSLYLLENHSKSDGHWIGVKLRESGDGKSPIGARIWITFANGTREASAIVCGDSLYAQHAPIAHFGLGTNTNVEKIEIRWPDGSLQILKNPKIDQYHDIETAD